MPVEPTDPNELGFYFYKGNADTLSGRVGLEADIALQEISSKLAELTDAKHLAFLLGSGCSSYVVKDAATHNDKKEFGIPTMLCLSNALMIKIEKNLSVIY